MCYTYNWDYLKHITFRFNLIDFLVNTDFPSQFCVFYLKGSRMGHSSKVSLWCVSLLINTRFHLFVFKNKQLSSPPSFKVQGLQNDYEFGISVNTYQ